MIELVVDGERERLNLLLSDGEDCRLAPRIEYRGHVYAPPDIDRSILRALTWPTECKPYGSTDRLFTAVRESFSNHGFPEEVALGTTYGVFASWFPECLPAAPCLAIKGPRPEASLLLQLLGCLVRRALPLAEVSSAGLSSLPMDLRPTLLIHQEHLSPSASRLLFGSSSPNVYVARKGKLLSLYCPRAIYTGDKLGDDLLGDAALHINLAPSRGKLAVLEARTAQEIAWAFQPQLLAYRLRNFSQVRNSQFDIPVFASQIRVLARVLGASIVDAPGLQAGLGPLLKVHQDKIRAERWLDLRCVTLEGLLCHCHSEEKDRVYVGELTQTVTAIWKLRGETAELEPRAMGPILRSFGLTSKRDSNGWSIRLCTSVRRRIHQLAGDYDVPTMQEGVVRCTHCSEVLAARENPGNPTSEDEQ